MNNNQYQQIEPVTNSWTTHWPSKLAYVLALISTVCGLFTAFSNDLWYGFGILPSVFSWNIFSIELVTFVPACASTGHFAVVARRRIARQAFGIRAGYYFILTVLPFAFCVPIFGITFTTPFGVTLVIAGIINLLICAELMAAQLFGVPLNNEHLLNDEPSSAC